MSLLLVLGGAAPAGVSAAWNSTESGDSAAFAVELRVSAAWASLEAGDSAELVAQLRIDAAWASVEGSDAAAFVGNVAVQGAWNASEGADVAAFSGNVSPTAGVEAVWNATEGGDAGAFAIEVAPEQQPFFPRGGGPFIPKYGYYGYGERYEDDDDLESARGVRQALDREGIEVVHAAAQRAASAIRKGDAEPVLDAERIYAEVIARVRGTAAREVAGILAQDRVDAYWRAEVRKRLQERDDEEVVLMIAELL